MSEPQSEGGNGQLKALVERIENIETEINELNGDKKDVFSEARANGFDVPTIKKVIAIRRKDPSKRAEEEAILDLYLSAVGVAP